MPSGASSSSSLSPQRQAMERIREAVSKLNIIVMAWGAEHWYSNYNGG